LNECGPKQGGMNLDDGQNVKTKFWTPFFSTLRKDKEKNSKDKTNLNNERVMRSNNNKSDNKNKDGTSNKQSQVKRQIRTGLRSQCKGRRHYNADVS